MALSKQGVPGQAEGFFVPINYLQTANIARVSTGLISPLARRQINRGLWGQPTTYMTRNRQHFCLGHQVVRRHVGGTHGGLVS